MNWNYFLNTFLTPVISAVAVWAVMLVMQRRKSGGLDERMINAIKEAVKNQYNELKIEIHKYFTELQENIAEKIEYNSGKNELTHKEFYDRMERVEKDNALLKQTVDRLEKELDKKQDKD